MASTDAIPHFGNELKDSFKPVNSWVANGIQWIDDVQTFYRERSAIEREYAAKLSALAKRYFEKKSKKAMLLSVGETPAITPGSLECASMATWSTHLNTVEQRAAEHDKFGQLLINNVAEPLKGLSIKYEELRKAHVDYNAKLEKERDSSYADLRKMKGKYDSVCQEVENKRKRNDGGQKSQIAFQQQTSEMHNVKNTYIIAINVTNKQKDMYYNHYVPDILNSLQDLNETRVDKLNSYLMLASEIEKDILQKSREHLLKLDSEIPRNKPHLDSLMFARHNQGNSQVPPDMGFEPSPVWHDESDLAVDEAAKNFLRNVLLKSKSQLADLKRGVDGQRREVDELRKGRNAIKEGRDQRDEVEVVRALFHMQELLHESERSKITAEVEIATITMVVGDVSIGARNHNFKSETFTIPTHCDYCGDRIWGLSAKGFNCRDCGFTCHSKCEMKIPAECPGELNKEEKKKIKVQRQEAAHAAMGGLNGSGTDLSSDIDLQRSDTMTTRSSSYSVPQRSTTNRNVSGNVPPVIDESTRPSGKNRILAPPPRINKPDESGADGSREKRSVMLYSFQKNGDDEISIPEGQEIIVLEDDDGSGWIRVRSLASNESGIVPTAYTKPISSSNPTKRPESSYSAASSASQPDNSNSNSNNHTTYNSIAAAVTSVLPVGGGLKKKQGPAVAPRRGAKKIGSAGGAAAAGSGSSGSSHSQSNLVEAMFEYAARTEDEHSIEVGERFVLVARDAGDGWAQVNKGGVVKSVPANYIREVV